MHTKPPEDFPENKKKNKTVLNRECVSDTGLDCRVERVGFVLIFFSWSERTVKRRKTG